MVPVYHRHRVNNNDALNAAGIEIVQLQCVRRLSVKISNRAHALIQSHILCIKYKFIILTNEFPDFIV